jgi:hypothetical protein
MANKNNTIPNISGLLEKITRKRDSGELPKVPIQAVQPITSIGKSEDSNTLKSENSLMAERSVKAYTALGRPSVKKSSTDYVKISPRIPKKLKKLVDIAIIEERFQDADGCTIKTLDEITAFSLELMLKSFNSKNL